MHVGRSGGDEGIDARRGRGIDPRRPEPRRDRGPVAQRHVVGDRRAGEQAAAEGRGDDGEAGPEGEAPAAHRRFAEHPPRDPEAREQAGGRQREEPRVRGLE